MEMESGQLGRRGVGFGIVGLSGVIVNTALVYVLHGTWHWPLPLAVALATEMAMLNNYLWNDRWTFGQRRPSLQRLVRFNLSSLGGLIITTGATSALTSRGVPYLPALLVSVAVGSMGNFATSNLWVWRKAPSAH
jgi:dolichol-phosphate mannosyltransferase